jgi:SAM-dependent methyltransferase
MSDTVERFSNRVANYVKYRPGYPAEMLGLFRDEMRLTPESVIADLGSGTGLSARLFLENGNKVYGVEPNAAMRAAAEEFLKDFPTFESVDGMSTATTLPDASIDIVIAAQAFHWFDPEPTRDEIRRVTKPGGHVALIWNERQLDTTPFLREYESLLQRFANDYAAVRHDNVSEETLARFFGRGFERRTFENRQVFDFEGLRGRLLSSSYMPAEDDPQFAAMNGELHAVFAKHAEGGKITVFYDTNVFYSEV